MKTCRTCDELKPSTPKGTVMTDCCKALSHEIWATAQLTPGEGIADGAARVEALLREALAALKAENEMLRKVLKDTNNELDWLDEEVGTCDHSVGVCTCSYWDMRRKMKAALSKENSNE